VRCCFSETQPTQAKNRSAECGFKTKQQVSIITLEGRIVVPYDGYNKHLDLIANGALRLNRAAASIGAAKIVY
jgi:putative transposase